MYNLSLFNLILTNCLNYLIIFTILTIIKYIFTLEIMFPVYWVLGIGHYTQVDNVLLIRL